MMAPTGDLDGKDIFLVEDEYLVAVTAAGMLKRLGAKSVVTAHCVEKALALAQSGGFDAAILDVNLAGERSQAVADALEARGVPHILATGYSRQDLGLCEKTEMIDKPYTPQNLAEGLKRVMKPKQG
jgi:CheY-like chemotaxis protein